MALNGKVVLVTGAARGMGRAYVRGFLARWRTRGSNRSRVGARAAFRATTRTFAASSRREPDALVEVMDISIDSHVTRVFDATIQRFGTVDVIVNNAGLRQRDLYPPHGSVTTLETEVGDWQAMFDTHVFGTFRVIKRFAQPMLAAAAREHRVRRPPTGSTAGARKAARCRISPPRRAMVTMALYLAHELSDRNIAVNVLLPGHTRSTGSDEQEAERARMREQHGRASRRLTVAAGAEARRAAGAAPRRARRERRDWPGTQSIRVERGARRGRTGKLRLRRGRGSRLSRAPRANKSPPTLWKLFAAFLEMTLSGFGGVLAWAHRTLVERRGWLGEREFAALLGLCQVLPGGNIINVAVFVGDRFHGTARAWSSRSRACCSRRSCWCCVVGNIVTNPAVARFTEPALRGAAPVVAGMVLATGLKMARPYRS